MNVLMMFTTYKAIMYHTPLCTEFSNINQILPRLNQCT